MGLRPHRAAGLLPRHEAGTGQAGRIALPQRGASDTSVMRAVRGTVECVAGVGAH